MSSPSLSLRLTALATASALALATAPNAWSAPPPIAPRADPPSRVARVSRLNGAVSFHTADADRWSPAALNYPITTGNAFWTEPGARVDLQLAVNRLMLAPSTELDVAGLDDHTLSTSEPQGETFFELRQVPSGDSYALQTPRGTVQITTVGRYDVVAGDATHPTLITVVDGAAQVTGPNISLQVGPNQTATLTGSDTLQGSVGPVVGDPFLTAMLAEDKPVPRATVTVPTYVEFMTGAEDLDTEGQWQETPQYGTVWYPPVQADWVPYRDGHWAYVAPWGWTWVDNASWGFAPFHYGRWAQVDNRWGWIPGAPGAVPIGRPVYAPALVSFIDLGGVAVAGAAVGFAAGALAGRSVGWVPLGPGEPYYPPYRSNLGYVRSLNATNVQNVSRSITTVNIVNNQTTINRFVNRGAATVVPAAAMVRSSPITAANRPLGAAQLAQAHAAFNSPVAPGPTTVGVTPAVARQFNFVPANRPAQAVPGPAIHPAVMRPGFGPQAGARPPGAEPAIATPAEPNRPAAPDAPRAPGVPQPAAPGGQFHPPAGLAPGQSPAARPPQAAIRPPQAFPQQARPAAEAPRVEAPRVEIPRVEAPRVEAPRAEPPRPAPQQAPRPEPPRAAPPPRPQPPRAAPPPRPEPPRAAPPRAAPARPAEPPRREEPKRP